MVVLETLKNFYSQSLYRQAVMNGGFNIWQREAAKTFTVGYKSADRWQEWVNADGGTLPVLTSSRQALTPGELPGLFYFYRSNWNGAGSSLGANSESILYTRLENATRLYSGKKATLTFYARSNIAGKLLGVSLTQNYGTGGSPSSQVFDPGFTVALTSNWQLFTLTFQLPTLVGKTFGSNNDDYLELAFQKEWGANLGSRYSYVGGEGFRGAGQIDITGVNLNAGEKALPYYPFSFADELNACMRYFEKSFEYGTAPADATGTAYNAPAWVTTAASQYAGIGMVYYKVQKRAVVSPVFYNPFVSDASKKLTDINNSANRYEIYAQLAGTKAFFIGGAGVTTIPAGMLVATNWSDDAEL